MTILAILNDVHDAEWIRLNYDQYRDTVLMATHASVYDHLEVYGIPCEDISAYLESDELLDLYAQSEIVKELLHNLDREFGVILNEAAGLDVPLDFFFDLYRYMGRYEYFNHLKLELALGRIFIKHDVGKVLLFESHFAISAPSFFLTQINIYDQLLKTRNVEIERLAAPLSKKIIRTEKVSHRFAKARRLFWFLSKSSFSSVVKKLMSWSSEKAAADGIEIFEIPLPAGLVISLDGKKSTTLFFDPSSKGGDLLHIHRKIMGEGISVVQPTFDVELPEVFSQAVQVSKRELDKASPIDLQLILRAIFLEDLARNFNKYLLPVRQISHLGGMQKILGAIWVSPPIMPGAKPLIVEYLIRKGISVIGRQHGGNYGIEHSYLRHFDSDFRWCTHYLSYGFTEYDLIETDPDQPVKCKIVPVGIPAKQSTQISSRGRSIDLLFPISNATYFHRDAVRPLQYKLAGYQRNLLRFLNKLPGVRVIIKPFHLFDHSTSSFVELLHGLKDIEVVDYIDFDACFEQYQVGAVIIEYLSSPVFESLAYDVEVLVLNNPLLPFNPTATALLRKRVHLFDNLSALEQGISDFIAGRLPRLRDTGFVDRYLLRDDGRSRRIVQEMLGML